MIECETKTRKWGNSLGITLPKEVVRAAHLKENERIQILIVKKGKSLKPIFGLAKGKIKESAQEIKDQLRKELYGN